MNNNLKNCYKIEFVEFDHMKQLGFVSKLDTSSQRKRFAPLHIYDLLLKHEENDSFLKRIVTGDENCL